MKPPNERRPQPGGEEVPFDFISSPPSSQHHVVVCDWPRPAPEQRVQLSDAASPFKGAFAHRTDGRGSEEILQTDPEI